MDANKILQSEYLDIVFDDRNKQYGAYELRKGYNKRMAIALVITASVALLAFLGTVLANQLKSESSEDVAIKEVTLQDINVEEEEILEPPPPPPPPPPPEPPKIEMKQFIENVKVVEKVETPPPPQEELKEVKIADFNQEGIKAIEVTTPVVVVEEKKIVEVKKEEDPDQIFQKVEKEAQFAGGTSAWAKFLRKNLRENTPIDNNAPAGQYKVMVQFVVERDGSITDLKPLTSHGYGMEEEAMRVLQKAPSWEPGIQNGRKVRSIRRQPITFVVEEN